MKQIKDENPKFRQKKVQKKTKLLEKISLGWSHSQKDKDFL